MSIWSKADNHPAHTPVAHSTHIQFTTPEHTSVFPIILSLLKSAFYVCVFCVWLLVQHWRPGAVMCSFARRCSRLTGASQQAGDQTELPLSYRHTPTPFGYQRNESAILDVFSDPARQQFQLIIVANALLIMKKPHAPLILMFEHQLFEVLVGISNKFQRPRFGIKTWYFKPIPSYRPYLLQEVSRMWGLTSHAIMVSISWSSNITLCYSAEQLEHKSSGFLPVSADPKHELLLASCRYATLALAWSAALPGDKAP